MSDPLSSILESAVPEDETRESLIRSVIPLLLGGIAEVSKALRESHRVSAVGTANSFGDNQLNVDVEAEKLLRKAISRCPFIASASSEEDPVERPVKPTTGQYCVVFDPLDGSSIISANWTVGTIVSIWDGPSALGQVPAQRQVAAILGVYGPRTTAIVAVRIPGTTGRSCCFEVALDDKGWMVKWRVTRPNLTLSPSSSYFSPANLRAASQDPRYMSLVTSYISRQYTLRYAGGLVPDVVHMLVQGQGVYLSPVDQNQDSSKAKLRRLYELCPLALVVECAGGSAIDPSNGQRILERVVQSCDERGGIVLGSTSEAREAVGVLSRS
ncbi:Sedoheptulose-1,7-bisphosphatase, chloroplastic [Achaetomium macrosporum]|uniref:Sedoheptulose-1,7-bisphosphatase, chloroplastic n=1 Tax=Achaetomium macrosporum TaxID=79813 RepID=A0AAN7CAV4_9PEZI|nr:Sedoheptulose-1,7-bisphosphatase, chloroplastic [Achaetomium macrosporum]